MAEIETVAVLTAAEGRADDLLAILGTLAAATQAEPGCVFYAVQRGLEDRATFVTVERWASAAALDEHRATPHLLAAREAMKDVLGEPPRVVPTEILDVTGDPKGRY